jgi:hypothetical protein
MESIDYLAEPHGIVLKGNEQCGWVHRRVTILRKAVCMTSRRLLDNSINRVNTLQFVAVFQRYPAAILCDSPSSRLYYRVTLENLERIPLIRTHSLAIQTYYKGVGIFSARCSSARCRNSCPSTGCSTITNRKTRTRLRLVLGSGGQRHWGVVDQLKRTRSTITLPHIAEQSGTCSYTDDDVGIDLRETAAATRDNYAPVTHFEGISGNEIVRAIVCSGIRVA